MEAEEAEKVLAAYPPGRLRNRAECLKRISEALDEGISSEDLAFAVRPTRTKVQASPAPGFASRIIGSLPNPGGHMSTTSPVAKAYSA